MFELIESTFALTAFDVEFEVTLRDECKKKKKKSFNKRQFEEIIRRSLADTISKLSVRVLSRKRRRNGEEEKEHVEDNEVHGIIWNLIEMKEEGSIEASTFRPEPFQLN